MTYCSQIGRKASNVILRNVPFYTSIQRKLLHIRPILCKKFATSDDLFSLRTFSKRF